MGSTLPTPRSTPGLVLHILLSFRWLFPFFVVFAIGLLCRFLNPILDPLAFVPNTFYKHNLSKYGLFQSLSQPWPFPKPWFTHMLWFKLKPWFEQNQNPFASKPSFTQRAVLRKNCVIHKHPCFTQKQCSCWACASAVCSLQDSSFHGGRRNTPKAVK